CIVTAIREAVADLKPASLGFATFDASDFVRNRLVGRIGKIDPEFSLALVKQQAGKMAVLGSYSAHATVLSSDVMQFSADYPGCWQRAVEEATGGLAVFLAGGVGSHSPIAGASGFAGTERMGKALASEVLKRLAEVPLTNQIAFDFLGLDIVMPPL